MTLSLIFSSFASRASSAVPPSACCRHRRHVDGDHECRLILDHRLAGVVEDLAAHRRLDDVAGSGPGWPAPRTWRASGSEGTTVARRARRAGPSRSPRQRSAGASMPESPHSPCPLADQPHAGPAAYPLARQPATADVPPGQVRQRGTPAVAEPWLLAGPGRRTPQRAAARTAEHPRAAARQAQPRRASPRPAHGPERALIQDAPANEASRSARTGRSQADRRRNLGAAAGRRTTGADARAEVECSAPVAATPGPLDSTAADRLAPDPQPRARPAAATWPAEPAGAERSAEARVTPVRAEVDLRPVPWLALADPHSPCCRAAEPPSSPPCGRNSQLVPASRPGWRPAPVLDLARRRRHCRSRRRRAGPT